MYLHSEVRAVGSPEPTLQADRDTARCDRNEPLFISHLMSGNPPPLILDHCRGLFLPWSFNPSSETHQRPSRRSPAAVEVFSSARSPRRQRWQGFLRGHAPLLHFELQREKPTEPQPRGQSENVLNLASASFSFQLS